MILIISTLIISQKLKKNKKDFKVNLKGISRKEKKEKFKVDMHHNQSKARHIKLFLKI